jgi:hypothetical protein
MPSKRNSTHTIPLALLLPFLLIGLSPACDDTDPPSDADVSSDGDADVDGDGDSDTDGDGDADSDVDGDSDADSDVDSDADSDVDGDSDSDVDGDGDSDADADEEPEPECIDDSGCPGAQGCYEELCRPRCVLGTCLLAPGGGYCRDGFCVECVRDDHCDGSRYVCDLDHHRCAATEVDTSGTSFGIFYSTWHCPFAADNPEGNPVHDISEIIAGRQSWGALRAFHWWDQPEPGYYCLSRNDELLRRHAELLRDAGIDFIFFDATNHAYVDWRSDRTAQMILEPLDRILAVWSTIPGAPQIVPWVPIVEASTNPAVNTIDAILERFARYPGMHFEHLGRPLILVTENSTFVTSEAKIAELERSFTVRRMWAHLFDDGPMWSFMESCEADPTSGDPCRQRSGTHDGAIEQVSITTAYQMTYMSVPEYAVPKHRGLTFRRQFQTLFDNPEAPIATITGWNEWIAQRMPCGENPTCPCSTYPQGCFMDQYDVEYSRDIEPGRNEMGDYFYRLLASCIALYRSGGICDASTASELCCRDWTP